MLKELRRVLEIEKGFRICLHDKDWIIGADIVDNIQYSIENSRKTVLIITNNFAKSNWCQCELAMAHHHLLSEVRIIS